MDAVRSARSDDHQAIREVVAAAFGRDAEADLVERIRASTGYEPELELVAELEGRIVGHVMISDTTLRHAGGERTVAMLSPLAVAPAAQRGGVGGALVSAATRRAADRGEPIVVLEGSPRYYSRFGFVHSLAHGIELPLPDWAPPEAAQVLLLPAHDPADETLRGRVVHPPAFDGLE